MRIEPFKSFIDIHGKFQKLNPPKVPGPRPRNLKKCTALTAQTRCVDHREVLPIVKNRVERGPLELLLDTPAEKSSFLSAFPIFCPEPVLAKCWLHLYSINDAEKTFPHLGIVSGEMKTMNTSVTALTETATIQKKQMAALPAHPGPTPAAVRHTRLRPRCQRLPLRYPTPGHTAS